MYTEHTLDDGKPKWKTPPTLPDNKTLTIALSSQQPNETVRGWAYRILLENIIHLNLPPGTSITEQEVANLLRASRTPIREALFQLASDGFVETTSQKGTRVSLIDAGQVQDDRFMRMCLEQNIVRIACENMTEEWLIRLQSLVDMHRLAYRQQDARRFFQLDEEFHQTICASLGKTRYWEVIQKFSAHLIRARVLNINSGYPREWELVLEQHARVLDAMRKKEPESAAQAMENHLSRPGWDVGELRNRFGGYFVEPK